MPNGTGWTELRPDVKVLVYRLYQALKENNLINGKIRINSGFRSVEYQAQLRERYKRAGQSPGPRGDYGVAFNSMHMQRKAVDLSWSGFTRNNLQTYGNLGRAVGFRGIGYYNTFIHMDIGSVRHWNSSSASVAAPTAAAANYSIDQPTTETP